MVSKQFGWRKVCPGHNSKEMVATGRQGSRRTFSKPMTAAFSLKHCRQMSMPYFRIRPAWWAQTRHCREPFPKVRGRENQTDS